MGMTRELRLAAGIAAILAGGLVLSGCIGGPTYGTDKTAGEHLLDDLGSAVSLAPAKKDPVKYQPRPGLVLPPQQQQTALVEPQQSLASREANPAWVESPEETRARLFGRLDPGRVGLAACKRLLRLDKSGLLLLRRQHQTGARLILDRILLRGSEADRAAEIVEQMLASRLVRAIGRAADAAGKHQASRQDGGNAGGQSQLSRHSHEIPSSRPRLA